MSGTGLMLLFCTVMSVVLNILYKTCLGETQNKTGGTFSFYILANR